MIFPLLLMLSGSVKSAADFDNISVYPQYWFDDRRCFRSTPSRNTTDHIDLIEAHWGTRVGSLKKIEPPTARQERIPR